MLNHASAQGCLWENLCVPRCQLPGIQKKARGQVYLANRPFLYYLKKKKFFVIQKDFINC